VKSKQGLEQVDAVVIGANMRGLVTTYMLSSLGYRAVLLERASRPGGVDGGFVAPDGTHFEFGLHVLDYMRSDVATRLFSHVVGGKVHKIKLARAIVLKGEILPYAPEPSQMPPELRRLLPSAELVDDLGDELPTRERLSRYYGEGFADLIFDEVLPSFPAEYRHRELGVDEGRLLVNIYPWFFPRAKRKAKPFDESRAFHDRLRQGVDQHILYPMKGGFGGFVDGFVDQFDRRRIEVLTGVDDLHLELEPGTHTAKWIGGAGRRFHAKHYFWATSWNQLCAILDLPSQQTATDRVLLGSFRLNRPATTDYHEMLVGDPDYRVNRSYFPARFRDSNEPLMQIEYAFPKAQDRPLEPEYWRDAWLGDARRLGIIDDGHEVEMFDFKSFCMHFNGYGMEGEPLEDADPSQLRDDSNIRPVVPSMANLNLNGYVPQVVEFVATTLARAR
jgi:protoporphyrinogen oxidase